MYLLAIFFWYVCCFIKVLLLFNNPHHFIGKDYKENKMEFKFLKAALAGLILSVSGFANAGVLLGDFLFNSSIYTGSNRISFNTTIKINPLWDAEEAREEIIRALPHHFTVNIDLHENSTSYFRAISRAGPLKSSHARDNSFSFDSSSLVATFHNRGYECLENTPILVSNFHPSYDVSGYQQGCHNTLSLYTLSLGELYQTSGQAYVGYDDLMYKNGFSNIGLKSIGLEITKYYYSSHIPGDIDDIEGVLLGSLKYSTSLSSPDLYITYVPETGSLGIFALGLFGLLANKRKKKTSKT